MTSTDLKPALRDFYITAAKEVDIGSGRKAIIIYVPFKIVKSMHKGSVQPKLVRELEKKFSGRVALIIAQRTILGKKWEDFVSYEEMLHLLHPQGIYSIEMLVRKSRVQKLINIIHLEDNRLIKQILLGRSLISRRCGGERGSTSVT